MEGSRRLEMELENEEVTQDALPSLMRDALSLIEGPEMDSPAEAAPVQGGRKEEENLPGCSTSTTTGVKKNKRSEVSIYRLPEEIWELILKEVKADKDLESCSRASPYLDMILTPTKPVWQFQKVVPHLYKYCNQSDFYNSRLVCKKWRDGIDKSVQDSPYDPMEVEEHDGGLYPFTTVSSIEDFLERFGNHPGNPFVDRSVFFNNQEGEPGFEEALIDFVERFGKHIWKLHIENINLFPLQFYINLRIVLIHCENLRHLRIDGQVVDMDDVDDAEIQAMGRFILNSPLPFVPSLETLWIRPFSFTDFPDNIHTMMMLPYATQLKNLSIEMSSWKDFYARGLINLKEVVFYRIPSNEILEQLLLLTAPIETMTLTFAAPRIDLLLLTRVIANFPVKTVKLILVELVEGRVEEVVEPTGEAISALSQIRCPEVHTFDITHSTKFSYNFLRAFPSLRKLKLRLTLPLEAYLDENEESGEDVQLYRMVREGELYRSNVWTLFPKLEHVQICDSDGDGFLYGFTGNLFEFVGTRKEYMRQRHQPSITS